MQIGFSICDVVVVVSDWRRRFTEHTLYVRIGDHKWHWPRTLWIKLNSCRVRRCERDTMRVWHKMNGEICYSLMENTLQPICCRQRCRRSNTNIYTIDAITFRRALNGNFDSRKCAEITRSEKKNETFAVPDKCDVFNENDPMTWCWWYRRLRSHSIKVGTTTATRRKPKKINWNKSTRTENPSEMMWS